METRDERIPVFWERTQRGDRRGTSRCESYASGIAVRAWHVWLIHAATQERHVFCNFGPKTSTSASHHSDVGGSWISASSGTTTRYRSSPSRSHNRNLHRSLNRSLPRHPDNRRFNLSRNRLRFLDNHRFSLNPSQSCLLSSLQCNRCNLRSSHSSLHPLRSLCLQDFHQYRVTFRTHLQHPRLSQCSRLKRWPILAGMLRIWDLSRLL